jgi:RES domain-containing protein
MVLWRISNFASLSGIGAEFESGRWHTAAAGKRMVYLSEHPAVALIENLVSLDGDPRFIQSHFQLLKVSSPDGIEAKQLAPKQLASIDPQDLASSQSIGDRWLAVQTTALLRVPSIPSPESWNYLLNPLHADASALKLDWAKHITYDRRLFQLSL